MVGIEWTSPDLDCGWPIIEIRGDGEQWKVNRGATFFFHFTNKGAGILSHLPTYHQHQLKHLGYLANKT